MEKDTSESLAISNALDMEIRDTGKKVQKFETDLEIIMEKLTESEVKMEESDKDFKEKEEDVGAACRRVMLMEGEAMVSVEKLATTVMKLALISKEADSIVKEARHWESKNMNNEMELENLDNSLKQSKKMGE